MGTTRVLLRSVIPTSRFLISALGDRNKLLLLELSLTSQSGATPSAIEPGPDVGATDMAIANSIQRRDSNTVPILEESGIRFFASEKYCCARVSSPFARNKRA